MISEKFPVVASDQYVEEEEKTYRKGKRARQ